MTIKKYLSANILYLIFDMKTVRLENNIYLLMVHGENRVKTFVV